MISSSLLLSTRMLHKGAFVNAVRRSHVSKSVVVSATSATKRYLSMHALPRPSHAGADRIPVSIAWPYGTEVAPTADRRF